MAKVYQELARIMYDIRHYPDDTLDSLERLDKLMERLPSDTIINIKQSCSDRIVLNCTLSSEVVCEPDFSKVNFDVVIIPSLVHGYDIIIGNLHGEYDDLDETIYQVQGVLYDVLDQNIPIYAKAR